MPFRCIQWMTGCWILRGCAPQILGNSRVSCWWPQAVLRALGIVYGRQVLAALRGSPPVTVFRAAGCFAVLLQHSVSICAHALSATVCHLCTLQMA